MNYKKLGAGITAIHNDTILIGLRTNYCSEPNTWNTIGGKFDNDIDLSLNDTASREFLEETGIYINPKELTPYLLYKDDLNNFRFLNFFYKFDTKPIIKSWDTRENVRFEWVKIREFKSNKYTRHYGLTFALPKIEKLIYPTKDVIRSNQKGFDSIYSEKY
jgi:8-oxo-dGTP pyrophosphatase MutT (NUDIX family)